MPGSERSGKSELGMIEQNCSEFLEHGKEEIEKKADVIPVFKKGKEMDSGKY